MNYIKYYIWFIKESQSFMCGKKDKLSYKTKIFFQSLYRGIQFTKNTVNYYKLTSKQKEDWYLSGEGRTLEY